MGAFRLSKEAEADLDNIWLYILPERAAVSMMPTQWYMDSATISVGATRTPSSTSSRKRYSTRRGSSRSFGRLSTLPYSARLASETQQDAAMSRNGIKNRSGDAAIGNGR
jgi:hypothetical protein